MYNLARKARARTEHTSSNPRHSLAATRFRIGVANGPGLFVCFVIGIAIVGKFGASMLAARLSRFEWREAFALGALMNTRGLMELVVLNIGLDLGILSAPLFAIMVLMALVTTFMTAPLVSLARIEQDTAD